MQSEIKLANAVWKVYLEPEHGWRPFWEQGLIGAVIIGNFILAVLVAIIMALWAQQARLLGDVLVSDFSADLRCISYSASTGRNEWLLPALAFWACALLQAVAVACHNV